ncbi:MAG: hypothetical protein KGD57_01770 [Candidatus Lokiarchaeota archaeon]|nr:hypothetical protein [Candidatus Lokiarchaeota archaeon]
MAFEQVLGDLQKEESADANKILESLLSSKNIDMKTHIINPVTFAILEGIIVTVEDLLTEINQQKLKLPLTKKLLKTVLFQIKKFMVSWNRQGRKEITETLQSIRQEGATERSFFQKMTGIGKQ